MPQLVIVSLELYYQICIFEIHFIIYLLVFFARCDWTLSCMKIIILKMYVFFLEPWCHICPQKINICLSLQLSGTCQMLIISPPTISPHTSHHFFVLLTSLFMRGWSLPVPTQPFLQMFDPLEHSMAFIHEMIQWKISFYVFCYPFPLNIFQKMSRDQSHMFYLLRPKDLVLFQHFLAATKPKDFVVWQRSILIWDRNWGDKVVKIIGVF